MRTQPAVGIKSTELTVKNSRFLLLKHRLKEGDFMRGSSWPTAETKITANNAAVRFITGARLFFFHA